MRIRLNVHNVELAKYALRLRTLKKQDVGVVLPVVMAVARAKFVSVESVFKKVFGHVARQLRYATVSVLKEVNAQQIFQECVSVPLVPLQV